MSEPLWQDLIEKFRTSKGEDDEAIKKMTAEISKYQENEEKKIAEVKEL